MLEYKLIRSKRRTISAEVLRDGSVVVRAPIFCSKTLIEDFLVKKESAIQKYRLKMLTMPAAPSVKRCEIAAMKREAERRILPRVEELSKSTGLSYQGAKITTARHRFGSCSGTNHLCFSVFLNMATDEELDYVIIHELCHTVEHNHSSRFYALVSRFLPDWKEREKSLKRITIPEIVD